MAKPNYSFEKRQRELAKKKKKEEKLKEKESRKTTPGPGSRGTRRGWSRRLSSVAARSSGTAPTIGRRSSLTKRQAVRPCRFSTVAAAGDGSRRASWARLCRWSAGRTVGSSSAGCEVAP